MCRVQFPQRTCHRPLPPQVERLCAEDPSNAEYITLRADLKDVIALTQRMVQAPQSAAGAVAGSGQGLAFEVGQRVEGRSAAAGGSIWYPAVVTAVRASGTDPISVKYVGFGSEEPLPAASVRPLAPPTGGALTADEVTPGLKVAAKYAGDGQWYAARVEGVVSDDGTLPLVEAASGAAEAAGGVTSPPWRVVRVTYTKYGNTETVPLEYLRHASGRGGGRGGSAAESEGAAAAAAAAAGDFTIPDHLRLQPTDSEADKKRKRRAVKRMKFTHKRNVQVAAAAGRKNSWKDFQSKIAGGSGKGKGTKRIRHAGMPSVSGRSATSGMFGLADGLGGAAKRPKPPAGL